MKQTIGPFLCKLNSVSQLSLTHEAPRAPEMVSVALVFYKDGRQIYTDKVIVPRDCSRSAVFDAAMRKPTLARLAMGMDASPGKFSMNEKLTIRLRTPEKATAAPTAKPAQAAPKPAQPQASPNTQQTSSADAIPAWKRALVWATSLATVVFCSTHISTLSENDQSLKPLMAVAICTLIVANLIIWFGKSNHGVAIASLMIGLNAPYGLLFILYYFLSAFEAEIIKLDLNLPDGVELILILLMCVLMIYLMITIGRLAYACAMDVRNRRKT